LISFSQIWATKILYLCLKFTLILRFCFYLEGVMPLRYVDFLEYGCACRFLEHNDGGSYRFRHKILQDYFASLP